MDTAPSHTGGACRSGGASPTRISCDGAVSATTWAGDARASLTVSHESRDTVGHAIEAASRILPGFSADEGTGYWQGLPEHRLTVSLIGQPAAELRAQLGALADALYPLGFVALQYEAHGPDGYVCEEWQHA